MGTPTQNGVVRVGSHEATPSGPDSSLRVPEGKRESDTWTTSPWMASRRTMFPAKE